MDEVTVIRHRVLVGGVSRRAVALELGVSRNTVRRYVEGAPAEVRKRVPRSRPALDKVRPRMDELLASSAGWTAGKQRLSATQLHRMLAREGIAVGVSLVKQYVHEWKRQRAEVFVPLVYQPGDLGEVDFFEVLVELCGKRVKAWMFLLRAMASGRDFAWLFPRQDQTCFLEGHVRAFEHLGGVLHRLAYDNLKAAVAKMLAGSERELSGRFAALANHYLFEPCFARPATGHDKGGVEARGKGIRWQHLVPIPEGESLESISRALLARIDAEAAAKKDIDGRTVLERFADEQARLVPLPVVAYRSAATKYPTVTRRALVQVEGATYSVWSHWAGLNVIAYVGVDTVELVGPHARVVHPRVGFGKRCIDYRHYLPELAKKPQALRQVVEELLPRMGEVYARTWRHLVDEHGPKQAARVFALVLKALPERGEAEVTRLLGQALAAGEPLQLALRPAQAEVKLDGLPESLRRIEVTTARAADFDELLRGVG